jgi:hypothetical protein
MSVVVSLVGATPPAQLPPVDQAVDVLPIQSTVPARTTAGDAIANMQKRPRAAAHAPACQRQSFANKGSGRVSRRRPSGVMEPASNAASKLCDQCVPSIPATLGNGGIACPTRSDTLAKADEAACSGASFTDGPL